MANRFLGCPDCFICGKKRRDSDSVGGFKRRPKNCRHSHRESVCRHPLNRPPNENRSEKAFRLKNGAPGGVRTPDLVLRRHTLYPSELRAHSESTAVEPLYYVLFRLTTRLGDRPNSAGLSIYVLFCQPPRVRFFTCLASFSICSAFWIIGSDRVFAASVFSTSSFSSVASL